MDTGTQTSQPLPITLQNPSNNSNAVLAYPMQTQPFQPALVSLPLTTSFPPMFLAGNSVLSYISCYNNPAQVSIPGQSNQFGSVYTLTQDGKAYALPATGKPESQSLNPSQNGDASKEGYEEKVDQQRNIVPAGESVQKNGSSMLSSGNVKNDTSLASQKNSNSNEDANLLLGLSSIHATRKPPVATSKSSRIKAREPKTEKRPVTKKKVDDAGTSASWKDSISKIRRKMVETVYSLLSKATSDGSKRPSFSSHRYHLAHIIETFLLRQAKSKEEYENIKTLKRRMLIVSRYVKQNMALKKKDEENGTTKKSQVRSRKRVAHYLEKPWHSLNDRNARSNVVKECVRVISTKTKEYTTSSFDVHQCAGAIEQVLYSGASSKAEYCNEKTLRLRIEKGCSRIVRAQRALKSLRKSPSGSKCRKDGESESLKKEIAKSMLSCKKRKTGDSDPKSSTNSKKRQSSGNGCATDLQPQTKVTTATDGVVGKEICTKKNQQLKLLKRGNGVLCARKRNPKRKLCSRPSPRKNTDGEEANEHDKKRVQILIRCEGFNKKKGTQLFATLR